MLRTLVGRGIMVARLYPHLPKTAHKTWLTAPSRARPILLQARMASSGSDSQASGSMMEAGNNRLAQEKSPYLLQHASNPVDWYPWGQEAFDKARVENKLIFLSVGNMSLVPCNGEGVL
ncbi:spermatogenesis-associated protein 20-like [Strongylocentrotus purpuratus]|uniref:Spermatogenesis-associated protein 20-like TRX domain-containing protein n=1 Tax=Strongylocentrotus purpuratus TaxID=7668 RepID=A0A7M7NWD4_STRPU|nr:spermatogenesis-associated protein 20-like [Strongylocentrotus purpuratus]